MPGASTRAVLLQRHFGLLFEPTTHQATTTDFFAVFRSNNLSSLFECALIWWCTFQFGIGSIITTTVITMMITSKEGDAIHSAQTLVPSEKTTMEQHALASISIVDEASSTTTSSSLPSHDDGIQSSPSPPMPCSLVAAAADTKVQHSPTTAEAPTGLRRIPSQIRLAILSLKRDQQSWEDMEDDLCILLDGKVENLQAFQRLFEELQQISTTTQQSSTGLLLRSLAYLCSTTAHDMNVRDEHVTKIANFLLAQRNLKSLKLSAIKTLVTCLSSPQASSQMQEDVIQGTLEFIMTPCLDWEYMDDHSAMALIYELRARCKREIELEQERIRRVADRGDEAAILISASAKLVELGIHKSNKVLEGHIDSAGRTVKGWVEVDKDPLIKDRDAVVAIAFSDAAKRASEYAREGTKAVVSSLCDASLSGLQRVGNKLGDQRFVENFSPEGKAVIQAVGKIGIATVGAAAIVGEAIVETGRSVASKTVDVTADVVGHKYGITAGEVAKNAVDTAENVFRTMGNTALLDGKLLAKAVARNVGKDQIDRDIEKAKEAIQSFEKNASMLMSQTLGIQWEGNWTRQLENSPALPPVSESRLTDSISALAENHDEPVTGTTKMASGADEDLSKQNRTSESPPKPNVSKSTGHEDHSAGDTCSLSSSVSTEVSGISFARRGKPSHRKGILLRPDMDPGPSSAASSHRKSYSAYNKRKSHQGQTKAHPRFRHSWA
jgi:hypothetical protein